MRNFEKFPSLVRKISQLLNQIQFVWQILLNLKVFQFYSIESIKDLGFKSSQTQIGQSDLPVKVFILKSFWNPNFRFQFWPKNFGFGEKSFSRNYRKKCETNAGAPYRNFVFHQNFAIFNLNTFCSSWQNLVNLGRMFDSSL